MKLSMRKMCLPLLVLAVVVNAANIPPRPQGPVGDHAGILDQATATTISGIAQALHEQAGFSLVVATVSSIGDVSIEEYATTLYETWGIGKKGTDEGALILLSLEPRRIRIEVGYGAEGYLPDARTGRLLDTYGVPRFRANDYAGGILALSVEIAKIAAAEKQVSLTLPSVHGTARQDGGKEPSLLAILFFIVLFGILMSTRFGRSLLFFMLLSNMMGGGRRGGGGFGGGFSSGGFGGGFGGGMSGGGGSSRSF
jgi:uncharacterized protein